MKIDQTIALPYWEAHSAPALKRTAILKTAPNYVGMVLGYLPASSSLKAIVQEAGAIVPKLGRAVIWNS